MSSFVVNPKRLQRSVLDSYSRNLDSIQHYSAPISSEADWWMPDPTRFCPFKSESFFRISRSFFAQRNGARYRFRKPTPLPPPLILSTYRHVLQQASTQRYLKFRNIHKDLSSTTLNLQAISLGNFVDGHWNLFEEVIEIGWKPFWGKFSFTFYLAVCVGSGALV